MLSIKLFDVIKESWDDVVIGLSGPNNISIDDVKFMNENLLLLIWKISHPKYSLMMPKKLGLLLLLLKDLIFLIKLINQFYFWDYLRPLLIQMSIK